MTDRRPALVRARDAAADWLVAGRDMAGAVWRRIRPDALTPGDPTPGCDAIPVVLLPGILEPWTWLAPMGNWLARHGHPVHHVETLGWNLRDIDSSAARCLEVLKERGIHRAVLVAHSKGGLIGKALLAQTLPSAKRVVGEQPDADPHAIGMVTLATPFGGSSLGGPLQRLPLVSLSPLGMFLPDSPQLTALAQEQAVNAHIVSLEPKWDQVIPDGSHLDGATNVTLDAVGHFRPLGDEAVWKTIHEFIHTLADATVDE